MNNVVVHPRLAAGSVKTLSRRIAANRAKGVAKLHRVIESLMRVANEPRFGFASGFIPECEYVLGELEALDPAAPPPVEEMRALAKQLESLSAEFLQRIIDAGRPSP